MANADNLMLAVNHAVSQAAAARSRIALLNPSGMGLDAKRNAAWCEYGFKETLTSQDLYKLYRRGGIAHGAVNKLVSTCWKTPPQVIEGDAQDDAREETAWERSLKPVATTALWRSFAEADRRRLAGRFAALILRIRDSRGWDQPVAAGGRELVEAIPAWEASLTPSEWDTDPQSEGYGKPKAWLYQQVGGNGQMGEIATIHPDRIFILGDYSLDAIGFLEPAYNSFVSIEKVEGGSGESFLKNAARQLNINFQAEGIDFNSLAAMYGVSVQDLQAKFNEVAVEMNRGNDTVLVTQGATTTPLVTAVPDPSPTYNINLQTVSAALDIPSRVLVGNQQGERASTEDVKAFNSRCQSRRNGDLTHEAHSFIGHLIRIRVVKPVAEYAIVWDDLSEATQAEKLGNAKTMSEINQTALASGEEVFTTDEIRTAAGYDPAEGGPALPDNDDDEDDDGKEAKPADPPA